MGTGSFPVVKRPGRGVDHPPPSSAEVNERVELYLYSPSGLFMACSRVSFTLTLPSTAERAASFLSFVDKRVLRSAGHPVFGTMTTAAGCLAQQLRIWEVAN
jgi:hypothetical protein